MSNKLTFTGANKLFLLFTVVFLVYQIAISFVFGTTIMDYTYLIILINGFIMVSFVIGYCLVKKINIKETFRFKKLGILPAVMIVVTAVPALLAATMFNNIVAYFLQFIGDIPAESFPVPSTIPELIIAILVIGVTPGVCEEIMHRGFLLKAYESRGSYKAVVIVAFLFGLFHFDITNLIGPIFLGVIIGFYVVRTDSIFAGMLAHFLNNAIAVFIQYMASGNSNPENVTLTAGELMSLIIIGVPALIITIGLLFLFKSLTKDKSVIKPPISRIGQDVKAVITHWPVIVVIVLYILMALLTILAMALSKLMGI